MAGGSNQELFGLHNKSLNLPITALPIDVSSEDFEYDGGFTIFVGGDGNIALRPYGSRVDITIPVQAGDTLPFMVSIVRSDSTTADPLFALYWERQILPPQPPTDITGISGALFAYITWNPPADDGGSPIVNYQIRRGPNGVWFDQGLVTRARITSETMPDIVPGSTNTLFLRSISEAGLTSEPSSGTSVTIPLV